MKAEKGLALQDIIQGIYEFAMDVSFPPATRVYFLDQLAQVECVPRLPCPLLASGSDERKTDLVSIWALPCSSHGCADADTASRLAAARNCS